MLGVGGSGGSSHAVTSPDGITWTDRTLPGWTYGWNCVAYGNGRFVALSPHAAGGVASTDGINWGITVSLPATCSWGCVRYLNNKFVVTSTGTRDFFYSSDGITWSSPTFFPLTSCYEIVYNNGTYIAVGFSGIALSADLLTWRTTSPTVQYGYAVTYGNGRNVIVSNVGGGGSVDDVSIIGIPTYTAHQYLRVN